MVIVLDTHIFVGACMGSGASRQVVAACLRGEHQPLMGAALFAEYEDVLGRDEVFQGSRLNAGEREELLDIFISHCQWTRIYFGWHPNLRDEASHIITRNLRDFARMELRFSSLAIISPENFLKEYSTWLH